MFVPSDKQISNSMKYLRQLKEQMELQKAKVDSIHFRNHFLWTQTPRFDSQPSTAQHRTFTAR